MKLKLKLSEALSYFQAIDYLIEISKKRQVQSGDGSVKVVEALVNIPPKVSYQLLKNRLKLKPAVDFKDEFLKVVIEKYKEDNEVDLEKIDNDKEYSIKVDAELNKYVSKHEGVSLMFDSEDEYDIDKIVLSQEDCTEKFSLAYIPDLLMEKLFVLE